MIYAYHRPCGASKLAKRLRLAIRYADGIVIGRHNNLRPHINWGIGQPSEVERPPGGCLNYDIRPAISKVRTFELLGAADLPVPRWTRGGVREGQELLASLPSGRSIIARRDGLSGGRGMTLVTVGLTPPQADFYVERLSCHREFRFHVFRGKVIHRQAKFVPHGFDGIARNHENGCYFTGHGLERFATTEELDELGRLSVKAVDALGLDFGAVDVLLTKKMKPYVLEVNTAPGLRTEATYKAYEGALRELYGL